MQCFEKHLSFWCISSLGTYLERCAVKCWPNFHPELLILKTKTFPLCKNNEKLEFRSQCKVLNPRPHANFRKKLVFLVPFRPWDLSRKMRLDETLPVMCCTSSEMPWASSYGHFFGTISVSTWKRGKLNFFNSQYLACLPSFNPSIHTICIVCTIDQTKIRLSTIYPISGHTFSLKKIVNLWRYKKS